MKSYLLPLATVALAVVIWFVFGGARSTPARAAAESRADAPPADTPSTLPEEAPRAAIRLVPSAVAAVSAPPEESATSEEAGAEELRQPIISAIRGRHSSSLARREAILKALEESGPSDESWTRAAPEVFDEWRRSMPDELDRRAMGEARCYRAGCEARVRFSDEASYREAAAAFRTLREEGARHGGRVQTPPASLPSGEIEVAWILLRPDVAPALP